jgi:hypothetical protein
MAANLAIFIKAQDQTHGAFKSVTSGLGDVLKTAAGFAVFQVASNAVSAFTSNLDDMVAGAREAAGIQAQLNNVIRSTGGAAGVSAEMANSLATSLQNVTLFEDDAIVAGENLLLTFTNIGKDVFPAATQSMLDMSQALGQDMKSSAIQLGKALNDPIKGVTALSRVGVSFTEEQKKLIERMVESGDVMGAQKLILAELNREFGGSAKAAAAAAGPMAMLNHRIAALKDNIGAKLIPVLDKLGGAALTVFERMQPAIEGGIELLGRAGEMFAEVLPGAMDLFGSAMDRVGGIVGPIFEGIGRTLDDVLFEGNLFRRLRSLPDMFRTAFEKVGAIDFGALLGNAGDMVGALLGGMGEFAGRATTWLGEQWARVDWSAALASVTDLGGRIIAGLGDIASGLQTWLADQWARVNLGETMGSLGDMAGSVQTWLGEQWAKVDWSAVWASAGQVAGDIWKWLGDASGAVQAWAVATWSQIDWPTVWGTAARIAGDIWKWLGNAADAVTAWVKAQWSQIDWPATWAASRTAIASGVSGMGSIASAVQDWLAEQWRNVKGEAVWSAMPPPTPGEEMPAPEAPKASTDFWTPWLTDAKQAFLDTMKTLWVDMPAKIAKMIEETDWKDVGKTLAKSLGDSLGAIGEAIEAPLKAGIQYVVQPIAAGTGAIVLGLAGLAYNIANALGLAIRDGAHIKLVQGAIEYIVQQAINNATGQAPQLRDWGPPQGGPGTAPGSQPYNPRGYALGGVVPGPIGAPQLAVVHGGETVIPVGGSGGGNVTVNLNGVTVSNEIDAEMWAYRIADIIQRKQRGLA